MDPNIPILPVQINYRNSKPVDFPFHSHAKYEVFYFQGGRCNYLIGNKVYVLQPGDLIIMHGMTLHCPNTNPNYDYIRTTIHFDPAYVQQLFQYPGGLHILKPFQELGNYRIHLSEPQQEKMEELLFKLSYYSKKQDEVSYQYFHIQLKECMLYIYELYEKILGEQQETPTEKIKNVQHIISYIEQHFRRDLQLDDIARALHLNKYYLSKIFKEVTGVTIFNYLLQHRINKAKVMFLLEKEKSVTEVAYLVGFKHPSHFSRIFRQQMNCTAEQYRRSIQNHTNQS